MKYFLILLITAFLPQSSFATIFQVGSNETYPTPHALYLADVINHGDTIYIQAATYSGTDALAVWQKNNLLIRGIGGRPHIQAAGENIWGKGIWVFAGNNITVENIEFSGATVPDENGAGIRLDGEGITVRYCFFHDNENGILTSNPGTGDILVEHSEFANNGFEDGFTHNIYVGHVNRFTFQYNYTHHAKVGHCIKSRARENFIYYNRIMDEETGYASRLIDLPNGGFSVVMGNLLMQGTEAINGNLVGYGLEGLDAAATNKLYFINNTCVNKRVASCIFIALENGISEAVIANNIFAGTGNILNGAATVFSNNLENTEIDEVGFANEANFDYQLTENSLAIDFGMPVAAVAGVSLTPDKMYVHPTDFAERMESGMQIDAGAYEFEMISATTKMEDLTWEIYPNPTQGILQIPTDFIGAKFVVIAADGRPCLYGVLDSKQLNINELSSGIYFLKIEKKGEFYLKRVVIE